jgi:hypothetical protein
LASPKNQARVNIDAGFSFVSLDFKTAPSDFLKKARPGGFYEGAVSQVTEPQRYSGVPERKMCIFLLALGGELTDFAPVYGITWNLQVMVNLQLNTASVMI